MNHNKEAFEAVRSGDLSRLQALVTEDPALVGARDETGISLLLHACYRGRDDIVAALRADSPQLDVFEAAAVGAHERLVSLLDEVVELATSWSPDGFTPLHLASYFGHKQCAAELLAHKCDVEATSQNPMKLRPIHSATARGNVDIVETLIAHGATVDAKQSGGWTALHAAAKHGCIEVMKALLEAGAEASATSDDGKTPLDLAESADQEQAAKILREFIAVAIAP